MTAEPTQSIVEATRAAIAADIAASENVAEVTKEEEADEYVDREDETQEEGEPDSGDDQQEEEGEAQPDDSDVEDKGSAMIPRNRYNKAREEAREEARKAAIYEDRYNQMLEAMQIMAGGGEKKAAQPEEPDIDTILLDAGVDPSSVVDKEGLAAILKIVKGGEKKAEEMQAQAEQARFSAALAADEARSIAKYPDFNEAYNYYIDSITSQVLEEAEERGLRYDKKIVKQQALLQASEMANRRFREGLPIGDWFYKNAQRNGYKPTEKKGLNKEAIEKNRAATEKKIVSKEMPDTGTGGNSAEIQKKYFKDGVFDVKLYQKDTQNLIRGFS